MELSTQTANLDSTFGYQKAIDILSEVGYRVIDYTLSDVGNERNYFSVDSYRNLAEGIRKYANSRQVRIGQTHAAFHLDWKLLPLDDSMTESPIFASVVRSIEISAILGSSIVVIHPIHHMVYEGHADEIREINFRYFRSLIPYCKEYGVRLAIENMFQKDAKRKFIVPDVCSDVEEHIRYIDELDSEYITGCLDVGHVGLIYGQEAQNSIRRLGADRLSALHICDNDYISDQHQICGFGKIDWKEIMRALRDIGYKGNFTYEADGFLVRFPDYLKKEAAQFMFNVGQTLLNMDLD